MSEVLTIDEHATEVAGALAPRTEQLPAAPQDFSILAIISRAAADPNVNVEKMQALLGMQRDIRREEAEAEFNSAFVRLQRALPIITRKGTLEYPVNKNEPDGPKRKISTFARWEDIMREIQPILDNEGFALSFNTAPRQGDGGGLIVTGTLLHVAGHSRSACIPLPLDASGGKNNLQAYGSAFSYGCRYTARMLLNFVTTDEDDDGKAAGEGKPAGDKLAAMEGALPGGDAGAPKKPGPPPAAYTQWTDETAKALVTAKSHDRLRDVIAKQEVRRRISFLRENYPDLAERVTAAESATLQRLGPPDEADDREIERAGE